VLVFDEKAPLPTSTCSHADVTVTLKTPGTSVFVGCRYATMAHILMQVDAAHSVNEEMVLTINENQVGMRSLQRPRSMSAFPLFLPPLLSLPAVLSSLALSFCPMTTGAPFDLN
jgi:hypothetical protein